MCWKASSTFVTFFSVKKCFIIKLFFQIKTIFSTNNVYFEKTQIFFQKIYIFFQLSFVTNEHTYTLGLECSNIANTKKLSELITVNGKWS